jgi:hypothetical protein
MVDWLALCPLPLFLAALVDLVLRREDVDSELTKLLRHG